MIIPYINDSKHFKNFKLNEYEIHNKARCLKKYIN